MKEKETQGSLRRRRRRRQLKDEKMKMKREVEETKVPKKKKQQQVQVRRGLKMTVEDKGKEKKPTPRHSGDSSKQVQGEDGHANVDAEVVRCHGVSLHPDDLETLRGPHWLTDAVLGFVFAMLSSKFPNQDDVLLVDPINSMAMSHDATAVAAMVHDIASRLLVLFAVNDNEDLDNVGGTHWSLLVLDNTSGSSSRFVHHDSLGTRNLVPAQRLAAMLRQALPGGDTIPPLVNASTPRQSNSYDCGIYVMAIAEIICGWWWKIARHAHAHGATPTADWSQDVMNSLHDHNVVGNMRSKLPDKIKSYADDDNKKKKKKK
uniref:Ubiquitin-like protease family profile domain-containing protein n=1 Tax=Oryza meridionalis TaxID=40149 RepID=A0A0E0F1C4_9ORYZ